ncbi:MAG: DUF4190 domain-containing protein [Actinobacteria bacterium]|nr:DUF4190 domain-containing protein [Actinomycetota bacterium]MBU1942753.1 DUF4190 domain-containing protein [Actinomycetota bacterium]MBU2686075.1 DUF4190 domain-containing protein [Actinomycetota bacterium]
MDNFCASCGQANEPDSTFCAQCGAPMQAQGGAPVQPPAGGAPPVPVPGAPVPPPGYGPPPGMGAPPPGYMPPMAPAQPPTDGMAIASLVLGIAGFFFCGLAGILAIIFGYMGKRNIRESGGRLGGDTFCTVGIVLGFIQLGIAVLVAIIWVIILIIAAGTEAAGALLPLPLLLALL